VTPLKVSIVTPSFNSARYIRETIQSVITQSGEFSIEYIVVDNCSTDGTREIVEEFQQLLGSDAYSSGCNSIELKLMIQQDSGMYDAINRGFEKASGDVYAWLNSDDIYLPGALATVTRVFSSYEDIHWLKGITSYIPEGMTSIWRTGRCLLYIQGWIKRGIYGRDHYFIQQDSVFWRADLWKKTGGIDSALSLAGDYYLWMRFAEHSALVTVKAYVSCFRCVAGQLSRDFERYTSEMNKLSPGNEALSTRSRLFVKYERKLPRIFRKYVFRILFGRQEASAVLINSQGEMKRISGEYYDVLEQV